MVFLLRKYFLCDGLAFFYRERDLCVRMFPYFVFYFSLSFIFFLFKVDCYCGKKVCFSSAEERRYGDIYMLFWACIYSKIPCVRINTDRHERNS